MDRNKKRYGVILGIVSIFTLSANTAFAGQATNQASIAITPGELAVTIPQSSTTFSGIQLNGLQQTATADVGSPITVLDSTGYGNGWTLQVNATPFQEQAPATGMASGTTPKKFPAGSLTLATDSSITPVGTNAPLPVSKMMGTASVIDNTAAVTVVSAARNAGMGEYQVNFPNQALTLTVNPGTTYVDTTNFPSQPTPYSSTITWQLNVGPASTPAPTGMQGSQFPAGSTAAASSSYGGTSPSSTIDGKISTAWNSGQYSGTLTYTFPSPESITGVQIAATASPTTSETYTISGLQNGVWTQIGQGSRTVTGSATIETPISVSPGNYDGIRIAINGGSSWVAVNEVTLQ